MSKDKVYSTPSPNISLSNEFRGNKGSTERQDGFSIDIYPHPQKSAGTSEKSENKKHPTTAESTVADDTVHYLSPASPLSLRTVCEGDYIYESPSFVKLLEGYATVHEYGSGSSSTISCVEMEFQRTMAFVKPEAMKYQDVILRAINQAGFSIIRSRTVHLTPEQVSEIYQQYYGSPAFPYMVVSVSVGPILTLSLAALNAVAKWKELVGPEKTLKEEWFYPRSMRLRFGLVESIPNAIHASENTKDAARENRYFNPKSVLEPIIAEHDKVCDYCNLAINSTLLEGLTEVVKKKPLDPVIHLAEWLLLNNPYQPRFPREVALTKT